MSARREDRELQIKLTELQLRQQHVSSLYTLLLAIEFSFMVLYVSLSFAIWRQSERVLNIFIGMSGLVALVLITLLMHRRQWNKLRTQIENLKKEYLW